MSYDDDHRGNPNAGHERGAYTPPTGDDDLPFSRGGYDPRRAPAPKAPPVTLIVSAVLLLLLIVAVVMFYRTGVRSANDAPPAVGTPVETMKVEAPLDAQPVNPEEGISVYRDAAEPESTTPTFTDGPEQVLPRPAPTESQPVATTPPAAAPAPQAAAPAPAPAPAAAPAPAPRPQPAAPAPAPKAATPAPSAATGNSRVQIGAFSSTAIADREYAAVASRFGSHAAGAGKGVEEVTTASGSTVYRTTFTGLSRDRAIAFCNALKAAGRDCLVR